MNKINRIKKILSEHKDEFKKRYKIKKIGIFGSYVSNKQNKKSDLDILVEFEKAPGLLGFIEIEEYLSKIVGLKVDLVMTKALKPYIGKHILREVIYI